MIRSSATVRVNAETDGPPGVFKEMLLAVKDALIVGFTDSTGFSTTLPIFSAFIGDADKTDGGCCGSDPTGRFAKNQTIKVTIRSVINYDTCTISSLHRIISRHATTFTLPKSSHPLQEFQIVLKFQLYQALHWDGLVYGVLGKCFLKDFEIVEVFPFKIGGELYLCKWNVTLKKGMI